MNLRPKLFQCKSLFDWVHIMISVSICSKSLFDAREHLFPCSILRRVTSVGSSICIVCKPFAFDHLIQILIRRLRQFSIFSNSVSQLHYSNGRKIYVTQRSIYGKSCLWYEFICCLPIVQNDIYFIVKITAFAHIKRAFTQVLFLHIKSVLGQTWNISTAMHTVHKDPPLLPIHALHLSISQVQ